MNDCTLRLTEHEMLVVAPGTPEVGPAKRVEFERGDATRAYVGRLVPSLQRQGQAQGYCLFLRPETQEESIFGTWEPVCFGTEEPELTPHIMRKAFGFLRSTARAGRFWKPRDEPFCFHLRQNGYAIGQLLEVRDGRVLLHPEGAALRWHTEGRRGNFLTQPRADFEALCQRTFNNERSEMRQLWDWLHSSDARKREIVFACERGTWSEMQHVFSLLLRVAQGTFGPTENTVGHLEVWAFVETMDDWVPTYGLPSGRFLQRWRRRLFRYFEPHWLDHPHWIYEWRQQQGVDESDQVEVRAGDGSADDLLKARMELRAWAKGKIPDPKIDALLGLKRGLA